MSRNSSLLGPLVVVMLAGASYADVSGSGPGSALLDPGTVTSDIIFAPIPDETVVDVELTINGLTHTWVGDLTATLTHVGTTTADIFVQVNSGNETSDFAGNYTFGDAGPNDLWVVAAGLGSTEPVPSGGYFTSDSTGSFVSLAAAFAGESVNGTWRLSINDAAGGDTGQFASWDLRIISNPVPEPSTLGLVGISLLGLAFFRRRN